MVEDKDHRIILLHMKGMLSSSCSLTLGIRSPGRQSLPDKQDPEILKYHKNSKNHNTQARLANTLNIFLWRGISPSSSVTKGVVLWEVGSLIFEVITDPAFYDSLCTHALPPAPGCLGPLVSRPCAIDKLLGSLDKETSVLIFVWIGVSCHFCSLDSSSSFTTTFAMIFKTFF